MIIGNLSIIRVDRLIYIYREDYRVTLIAINPRSLILKISGTNVPHEVGGMKVTTIGNDTHNTAIVVVVTVNYILVI